MKSDRTIFETIQDDKGLFNGFGLNLGTEALHAGGIHPMMSTKDVFGNSFTVALPTPD
jgi:hypothetical protein